MHAGEFEVVEIHVMKPRRSSLDQVIETHPEAVHLVGAFQGMIGSYLDVRAQRGRRPLRQRGRAHVVPGPGGGRE